MNQERVKRSDLIEQKLKKGFKFQLYDWG